MPIRGVTWPVVFAFASQSPASSDAPSSNGSPAADRIRAEYELVMQDDAADGEQLKWVLKSCEHAMETIVRCSADEKTVQWKTIGNPANTTIRRITSASGEGYTETLTLSWPDGTPMSDDGVSSGGQGD